MPSRFTRPRFARPLFECLRRNPRIASVLGLVVCVALVCASWLSWDRRESRRFREAVSREDFTAARTHLDHLQSLFPDREPVLIASGRLAWLTGQYTEAEGYLRRAKKVEGSASRDIQKEFVLLRAVRGDLDEVSPALDQLLRENDIDTPMIYRTISQAYMRELRLPQAWHTLKSWLEVDGRNPHAWFWYGWVCEKLHQNNTAIDGYLKSLELRPDHEETRMRLIDLLISERLASKALPHIEYLRSRSSDLPELLGYQSVALFLLGRLEEAAAVAREAIAADPDQQAALICLGKVMLQSIPPDFVGAEPLLRRARDLTPWNPEAQYSLYLSLRGQPGRAADTAIETAKYDKLKDINDRLTDLFQRDLPSNPESPEMYAEIGELYLKIGQKQAGVSSLQTALRYAPKLPAAHKALADYYQSVGDTARADEHRRFLPAKAP